MRIYDMQLKSLATGRAIIASGGMALIVAAGATSKVGLLDANGAAATNPVSLTNGRLTFRTADAVSSVDAYIMTPTGHFVVFKGLQPGGQTELAYNSISTETMIAIPFLGSDYTAAAENDSGIDLPAGLLLTLDAAVHVTVAQATKTIDVGILSSETGGDADGLLKAVDIGAAAALVPGKTAATATRGALFPTIATTPVTPDKGYPTDGVAKSVSLTPSAGTTTAAGIILLPAKVSPKLFV